MVVFGDISSDPTAPTCGRHHGTRSNGASSQSCSVRSSRSYWAVARWAHVAAFPKYEGVNTDMKDPNGKLVQIELIKMAEERGSGWVD
jgi:hypothetical protein